MSHRAGYSPDGTREQGERRTTASGVRELPGYPGIPPPNAHQRSQERLCTQRNPARSGIYSIDEQAAVDKSANTYLRTAARLIITGQVTDTGIRVLTAYLYFAGVGSQGTRSLSSNPRVLRLLKARHRRCGRYMSPIDKSGSRRLGKKERLCE